MRAVIQRVSRAGVSIGGRTVASIGRGMVVLLGVAETDTEEDVDYMAEKLSTLRFFSDNQNRLNLSLQDVNGEMLLVSNFTVLGDTRKGRRPSYSQAASAEKAEILYNKVYQKLRQRGIAVSTGQFGAMMEVSLINDGPVTLIVDSKWKRS